METPGYPYTVDLSDKTSVPWCVSDVIFVYFSIFILSIIFAGTMLYANLDIDRQFFAIIFQILISLSILGIVYFIITQKYNLSFKNAFGIHYSKFSKHMSQGIVVTVIMIITTTFINLLYSEITQDRQTGPYMDMSKENFRWLGFLAVFFAPIVEEIFFRGFMQPAIIKRLGVAGGIIVTSLIFGISHTQYLEFGAALYSVTAIGLILGVTRQITGSIMPGIFAHFFNNFLAVLYVMT